MNPDVNQALKMQREAARRMGGRVFLWASISYMVGIGALILGMIDVVFRCQQMGGEYGMDRLQLPRMLGDREFSLGVICSLGAATVFTVLAWLIGRWAGSAIQVKGRGFGWVGPLTLLLPSMLGSLTGMLLFALQDYSVANQIARDWVEYGLFPWAVCTGVIFLMGILVGSLAGLYVRQQGRLAMDIVQWSRLGPSVESSWPAKGVLSIQRARALGMRVFAIGASLLSFVRLTTFLLGLKQGFSSARWNPDWLLPMVLSHLIFVVLAALVGRWVGSAILNRRRHFAVVGASAMALPAFAAAVTYCLGMSLRHSIDTYHLGNEFWDYGLLPTLEYTLLFYIPAIFIGIFAAYFLQYLGGPEEEGAVMATQPVEVQS